MSARRSTAMTSIVVDSNRPSFNRRPRFPPDLKRIPIAQWQQGRPVIGVVRRAAISDHLTLTQQCRTHASLR